MLQTSRTRCGGGHLICLRGHVERGRLDCLKSRRECICSHEQRKQQRQEREDEERRQRQAEVTSGSEQLGRPVTSSTRAPRCRWPDGAQSHRTVAAVHRPGLALFLSRWPCVLLLLLLSLSLSLPSLPLLFSLLSRPPSLSPAVCLREREKCWCSRRL